MLLSSLAHNASINKFPFLNSPSSNIHQVCPSHTYQLVVGFSRRVRQKSSEKELTLHVSFLLSLAP